MKTNWLITTSVGLLTLGFLALSIPKEEKSVKVARESTPKTVSIEVYGVNDEGEEGSYRGAGVYITPRGHVLTCSHLFSMAKISSITVTSYDGYTTTSTLLHRDDAIDLAILYTEYNHVVKYITLENPHNVQVGESVLSIGNPFGLPFTVTHGIVSADNRDGMGVYNMIQSDAFMNPGNSGGPLINMRGRLIGINSRIRPPVNAPIFTGLGFSVRCSEILVFLTKFKGLETIYWER